MTKIAKQLTELIGNTPLLELNKYSQAKGLETPVIAKVEFFNPGGTHQRKYGRRTGTGICREGLPSYPYHARDHECRAS